MKNIEKILIPVLLSFGSCKTIQESVTYKANESFGKIKSYQEMARGKWSDPKRTFVVTDSASFVIEGVPKIPLGRQAYIENKQYPSQSKKHKYFTWKGTKKEYRLLEK